MSEELKQIWIEAYQTTLNEYENDTHVRHVTSCSKCKIVGLDKVNGMIKIFNRCTNLCPEGIPNTPCMGCMFRLSSPENSDYMRIYRLVDEKEKLIEYHRQAIKYLETVLPITFAEHMDVIQKHLKEIDKNI